MKRRTQIERDFEADLIKQSWLGQMPSALPDEQLVADMRSILSAKNQAFNQWLPLSPGDVGNAWGHAYKTLHSYFSGRAIPEQTVFRRPEGVSNEHWSQWTNFASQIDWQSPLPSPFSPEGVAPPLAAQRVVEHVTRQAFGMQGSWPGLDPEEVPGVAMMGALEHLSAMNYLPAYDVKAAEVLNKRISYGMTRALSAANAQSRAIEQREIGFDFGSEYDPSDLQTSLPPMLQQRADQPAVEMFSTMGNLTPEQDIVARQILGKYAGYTPGKTLTVNDAYQLYAKYEETLGAFHELPDDLKYGLRYGKTGLENQMKQVGKVLQGSSQFIPPAVRAQAEQYADPIGNVSTNDPLASQNIGGYDWGQRGESYVDPFANEITDEDRAAIPSTPRDIQRARLEAAASPGMGPLYGPAEPPQQRPYVTHGAVVSGQSMSPAERTRQERRSAIQLAYENRSEFVSGIQDKFFDAYQAYTAEGGTLSFDDWINAPEVSGVDVSSARQLLPDDINTELLDRIEGMSPEEFASTVEGVQGRLTRNARLQGTPMPPPGSGRLPRYLTESRAARLQATPPEPINALPSGEVLTEHGYRRTAAGRMMEAATQAGVVDDVRARAEAVAVREEQTPGSPGQPPKPPNKPPVTTAAPEPDDEFPAQENQTARELQMLEEARKVPYAASRAERVADDRYWKSYDEGRSRRGGTPWNVGRTPEQWEILARISQEVTEQLPHPRPSFGQMYSAAKVSRADPPGVVRANEESGSVEPPDDWNDDEWYGSLVSPEDVDRAQATVRYNEETEQIRAAVRAGSTVEEGGTLYAGRVQLRALRGGQAERVRAAVARRDESASRRAEEQTASLRRRENLGAFDPRESEARNLSRTLGNYLSLGDDGTFFAADYGLRGAQRDLALDENTSPEAWAEARTRDFRGVVRSSVAATANEPELGASQESRQAYSVALASVARSSEQSLSGHESMETMLKNISSRARSMVYDTLNEELKQAGGNLDVAEANNRITRLAESVIDRVVGRSAEALGVEATPGQLGGELHKTLSLTPAGQASAIRQLYQQDELFRSQVDASEGGLGGVLRRGGVFDRGGGDGVRIRGADREFDWGDEGSGGGFGGGRGGYQSLYAPIRAWYASRAMTGVLEMTLGQSIASMAGAEDFERALSVTGGMGPGPIQNLLTQKANREVWSGIAAEQQFGWMEGVPNALFGDIGGQRMFQAGRFALGMGASGMMANAFLGMMGGKDAMIEGLGKSTAIVGAGYLALAGFAEATGRDGVEGVLGEASYRGRQALGLLSAGTGQLLGLSNEGILRNPLVQWAMDATPPPVDNTLLARLEEEYEGVGAQGLNVTATAQTAAQVTRMFGTGASSYYLRGMQTTDDTAMAFTRTARDAGIDPQALLTSSVRYAQERYGAPGLSGMWEYAQMSPDQQFRTDFWTDASRGIRGVLTQSGMTSTEAWNQVQAAYPNLQNQGQIPGAMTAAQLTGIATTYGINFDLTAASGLVGQTSPGGYDALASISGVFARQYQGLPSRDSAFSYAMGQIAQGRYTDRQLSSIGQLAGVFDQSGMDIMGMFAMLPDYTQMDVLGQGRVRELTAFGGQSRIGTGWFSGAQVAGLQESQYGVLSNFLQRAYQGGGYGEMQGLFQTGVSAFGGLQGDQLNYAWALTNQFNQAGISWTGAATQASQMAPQMNGLQYGRYMSVFDAALGTGVSGEAAMQYATQSLGASGVGLRDLTGVLRGDPWALSRLSQSQPGMPPPTIDLNTGMSVWQERTWGLQDQAHTLQYGQQQWQMGQQWSQFDSSQAMQFGGSFANPMTGQSQTIQYGRMDIADALYDISVRQQRDSLAYQNQSLGLSYRYQRQGMQDQYQQTMTRFDWRAQDWQFQENSAQLQFAWQMEDYDEAIRFSRGRDRQRLTRQRDRAVVSESMREGQSEEQRERIDQEKRWAEEAHERQKNYFEDNFKLQEQRLRHDKQYFEERLQWQERERDLSRLSAELESHYRQAQLQNQQRVMAQEEQIYQQQLTIDRERIRVQGEIELWLQNIAEYVENMAASVPVGGATTPSTHGSVLPPPGGSGSVSRPAKSPLTSSAAPQSDGESVTVLREISSTLSGIARKGGGALSVSVSTNDVHSALREVDRMYNETYQSM